jgi:hypothetical protein
LTNKKTGLKQLADLKDSIKSAEDFKGKAAIIKKIAKDIQWITLHACEDNLPMLIYKERVKDFEAMQ